MMAVTVMGVTGAQEGSVPRLGSSALKTEDKGRTTNRTFDAVCAPLNAWIFLVFMEQCTQGFPQEESHIRFLSKRRGSEMVGKSAVIEYRHRALLCCHGLLNFHIAVKGRRIYCLS